jgi:molybdopterin synthase catalytic subunit
MRVRVRLFAALRERVGAAERELELPAGARAADVWPALPELGEQPPGVLLAVNKEYVEGGRELADGDEVALIPPVSGGGVVAPHAIRLTAAPIDVGAVIADAADERAGAVATFLGTTRIESRGRSVLHLDYEAYEDMAEQEMGRIADELAARYDLCRIAITHRIGRVEIGETSVAIAVSAPHRADALAACKDAIDTLKERVPLWKKEVYEGGEEWIGRGS